MAPNAANRIFLISIGALMLFGLAMLLAASSAFAFNHFQDNLYYVKKQLIDGVIPGIIAFVVASRFPYRKLKRLALPLFLFSLVLLALVFAPAVGLTLKGAARWLHIGSFVFQPSEIFKLALIVYLAAFFESKRQRVTDVEEGLVPFLGFSVLAGALLALEPDLGTLGVVLSIGLGMYIAAGAKWSHVAFVVLLGLVALLVFVLVFGHAMERVKAFLNPGDDAMKSSFQINQALSAIKSGGVFGLGFAEAQGANGSTLPEPMGDSIFAVIAQELGLVGVLATIGLFLFFARRTLRAAQEAPDLFGSLVATGVMLWVLVQAFINMSAISGILPLTGIPLPFVSYGGTALVVLLTACGIVYNIQQTRS